MREFIGFIGNAKFIGEAAGGDISSLMRQPIGNGNVSPYTYIENNAERILQYRKYRTVAENANWSALQLVYSNFIDNGTDETSDYPYMVLSSSIRVGTTFYQSLYNDASYGVLAPGSEITFENPFEPQPGQGYWECVTVRLPLLFDNQISAFTVGQTVTGATSGATGVIHAIDASGAAGNGLLVGLVSFWPLNEASGNAIDAHGANNLTETGGTIGTGTGKTYGTARDFERGDTEYFTIASNSDLQLGDIDWTIAGWANLESKTDDICIVSKHDGVSEAGSEFFLYYAPGSDRITFINYGASGSSSVTASALGSPSAGTWYFVIIWHDSVNNTINIQVNNGTVNSASWSGGTNSTNSNFTIGGLHSSPGVYDFDGMVQGVGLWKGKVFSAEERAALYNDGNGLAYTGLQGGVSGHLVLVEEEGTFQNNETITDPLGGYASVNFANQKQILSGTSHAWLNEGRKAGQNASLDLTTQEVVYPVYTCTINGSGNITGVTKVSGGSGWASPAPSMFAYGVMADGRVVQKTIGYANLSSGTINSGTVTSGTPPSGFSAWPANTQIRFGGNANAATAGFGVNTSTYWASRITGIPSTPVKSLTIIGDSIARGDTSADSTGDIYGNYGIIERAIANRCGIINMSRASARASYEVQWATIYPLLYASQLGHTTHGMIQVIDNDAQVGDTLANIQLWLRQIEQKMEAEGILNVGFHDVPPRTTSTDSWATEGNQTPATGFGSNGVVVNHNADLISGVFSSDFSPPLARPIVEGANGLVWVPGYTADGIHFSGGSGLGIAAVSTDATYKAYYNFLA